MSEKNNLPSGWSKVTIDVLLQPLEDGRLLHHGWSPQCEAGPSKSDEEWGVLKTTAVQDGLYLSEHNKRLPKSLAPRPNLEVRNGDILITCAGPRNRCGVPCLVRQTRPRLILSGKMYRFRVQEQLMHASFMEAYLREKSTQAAIEKMKTGISDSGLNLTHGRFLRLNVPVPPLSEQRRIIEKIDELFSDLDAGIAALERIRANLKRYRAVVLKAAVEGRLTEEWRVKHPKTEPASKLLERILAERRQRWEEDQLAKFATADKTPPKGWREKYVEPSAPDSNTLPELPQGWCWARVEQVGDVQLGRQRSPKNRSDKYPTKYIRAANITESGLALDDILDMDFSPTEQETYRLHAGDVVLSEASGSPDQVGKPAVWHGEIENCCFQNTVIRLRPHGLTSNYVLVVLRHCYFNKVFAKIAAGVGINHLSAAKFSVVPLPLAPIAEQEEIAREVERRLSIIAAADAQVDANLKRAARLRQCILKRAFEGRLVPQDPTDEPAEKLLARIRQERAAANGSVAPRTRQGRASSQRAEGDTQGGTS
jgi:type I restriction enzyme S subunit